MHHGSAGAGPCVLATWRASDGDEGLTRVAASCPSVEHGVFLTYSITKTFIAALVLRAADKFGFSLDVPASSLLMNLDLPEAITLRQLLAHTSGLPDYGTLAQYHEDVRTHPWQPWSFEEFWSRALVQPLLFSPGQGWSYSNIGYMLLKAVLERIHGASLREIVAHEICEPLGLHRTIVVETNEHLQKLVPGPSALVSADNRIVDVRLCYHPGWVSHGVVASTATELLQFVLSLTSGRVLNSTALRDMMSLTPVPGSHPPWVAPGYGLGLMGDTMLVGGPVFGHSGGGPGYSASIFARIVGARPSFIACALCAGESLSAQQIVLQELTGAGADPLRDRRGT